MIDSKTTKVRIIGDIRGEVESYLKIIKNVGTDFDLSIQLGDFGPHIGCLADVDPAKNKILPGDEDCTEKMSSHYLGEMGQLWKNIFYVMGEGENGWKDHASSTTEISIPILKDGKKIYSSMKPKIVISHTCPSFVYNEMMSSSDRKSQSSPTRVMLKVLHELHAPKVWFFSHPRKKFRARINGTDFIGLEPCEYIDLNIIKGPKEKPRCSIILENNLLPRCLDCDVLLNLFEVCPRCLARHKIICTMCKMKTELGKKCNKCGLNSVKVLMKDCYDEEYTNA